MADIYRIDIEYRYARNQFANKTPRQKGSFLLDLNNKKALITIENKPGKKPKKLSKRRCVIWDHITIP